MNNDQIIAKIISLKEQRAEVKKQIKWFDKQIEKLEEELCKDKIKQENKSKPRHEYINWYNQRKVLCVETGEIFKSVRSAARSVNVVPAKISLCCRGEMETVGGFHWKYVE